MSAEWAVALIGSTGIATLVSIVYQIWRERHSNVQKDMAGDLTLGELFRDAARREVVAVQHDMDGLRATVDRQLLEVADLRRRATECEDRYEALLARMPGLGKP